MFPAKSSRFTHLASARLRCSFSGIPRSWTSMLGARTAQAHSRGDVRQRWLEGSRDPRCGAHLARAVSTVDLANWARGRVAVLGDASSCTSLFGDGSTLAIAGAYTSGRLWQIIRATTRLPSASTKRCVASWSAHALKRSRLWPHFSSRGRGSAFRFATASWLLRGLLTQPSCASAKEYDLQAEPVPERAPIPLTPSSPRQRLAIGWQRKAR
jgi:hypothetical protein